MKQTIKQLKTQQELVIRYVSQLQPEEPNHEQVLAYLRKVFANLNLAINKLSGENRIKEVKAVLFELGIDEEFLN